MTTEERIHQELAECAWEMSDIVKLILSHMTEVQKRELLVTMVGDEE